MIIPDDPRIGQTLAGKYVLETLLGEGGMGGVYRARQTALDKVVAVKVMHHNLAQDPLFVARFHREAKAASRLDHENSVRVLDFGEDPGGALYLTMELLDGRNLLAVMTEEGPLSMPRVVSVVSQALSALGAAHEAGVLHRDLKPENIMLLRRKSEDGAARELVKICDFGIAQMADAGDDAGRPVRARRGKLTTAGLVIGTPDYMSPEQARGEPLDARSDLYSMGVILYHLLADRPPFEAATAMAVVMMHQTEEPTPPSSLRLDVDRRIEAVCLRAMRKNPADRYASAREMRAALRAALDPGSPVVVPGRARVVVPRDVDPGAVTALMGSAPIDTADAPVAPVVEPPAAPARRRRSAAWVAGLGLLALSATLLGARTRSHDAGATPGFVLVQSPPTPVLASSAPPAIIPRTVHQEPRALDARTAQLPSAFEAPLRAPRRSLATPPEKTRSGPSARAEEPSAALLVTSPPAEVSTPALDPAPKPEPPPPAAEPPAAVAPTTAPFDPGAARVTASGAKVASGGARASEVDAVVRAAMPRITECYRRAATATTPEGAWSLAIETDDEGNVAPGRLEGPLPAAIKECVARALGGKVHADTGPVTARVALTFSLR